jgi:hypothetical protein
MVEAGQMAEGAGLDSYVFVLCRCCASGPRMQIATRVTPGSLLSSLVGCGRVCFVVHDGEPFPVLINSHMTAIDPSWCKTWLKLYLARKASLTLSLHLSLFLLHFPHTPRL